MTIFINSNRLKRAMFLQGYNISELASELGVGVSYLSQILNNKKTPSPKLAKNIADTLGVEIKDIFDFEVKEVK
ncbi:helix-turn-helix transcriptional regulator [Staphylococcus warneri]|uniref:helix-turn-helix transcriptional regulator n=1 Tax=Staphylococcus warneri TaxID=1292 RepID=UPI001FB3C8F7|nr:helix-turn-helix transcriptional regulator [Staphylococcus warneri]MCJ1787577.1 helix-turn-helix transcriptional regulator [Staphylococcus warneri]MCJ1790069.1 helix-turn-helix transcriptional regulator [Staphylococcus warneri]MCJ1792468.1 helix-turn-helix transcriptional regulator [Staphylococcus warneri]MCJ1794956.1 helix-turn-helix transcriptional regulator [Staphylococcus warneri]MCJ1797337.1 helix-turn-helix transcriptional regulator [Staphylococcus warneri]